MAHGYKKIIFVITFLLLSNFTFAQLFQGPAQGSVDSGVVVNTNSFSKVIPITDPAPERVYNKLRYVEPDPGIDPTLEYVSTTYIEDFAANSTDKSLSDTVTSVLMKNFTGITQTNSIPPDPHIAAGPNHIVGVVNSRFAIWDRNGNLMRNIDGNSFYNPVGRLYTVFDPKVLYDHHSNRWFMVWLEQNDNPTAGIFLISISDDSDPNGVWFNWRIRSDLNGTVASGDWGDYQGVGFDKDALYITANQFQFGGSFRWVKIRVIPKAQMLGSTPGRLTWFDLWDVRDPVATSSRVFNIRPSIVYGTPPAYYLMHATSSGAGVNFVIKYDLINPTTNPSLTAMRIPVATFVSPSNANQLGGSTILIEGAGSAFRNEPTFRDGSLWMTHSVRNPAHSGYSAVRYLRIDAIGNRTLEDVTMGANGFWHIYAAIAVDTAKNVLVTYSRSGDSTFIGAYYATKRANDPPGLTGSRVLQRGRANYVKDFGSGRNRWGDYNGAWLDPDGTSFWLKTEFVEALNTWGTWIGQVRVGLDAGASVNWANHTMQYNPALINSLGDTLNLQITNFGVDTLRITSIPLTTASFRRVTAITFPIVIAPLNSFSFRMAFRPTTAGNHSDTLIVTSNDPTPNGVALRGRGYSLTQTTLNNLYALHSNGTFYNINRVTGATQILGNSGFLDLRSIAINPKNRVVFGVRINNNISRIVRLDGVNGEGFGFLDLNVPSPQSIAFDSSGHLFIASTNRDLFRFRLSDSNLVKLSTITSNISGMAFHPVTNELWATVFRPINPNRDRLLKINPNTGDTSVVGVTGFGVVTTDIEFDERGDLYGLKPGPNAITDFIRIDPTTGTGTVIAVTGFSTINSLAFSHSVLVGVNEDEMNVIPKEFALQQNYPNPFNPTTKIQFNLPVDANVELTIYDILGKKVATLVSELKKAGSHSLDFNSSHLSSGVYFYEIKADGIDGKKFNDIKKMIFMK